MVEDVAGVVEPPSTLLPPIKRLATISEEEISIFLSILRYLYVPEVRGSTRRRLQLTGRSSKTDHRKNDRASGKYNQSALEEIRADPFERAYAIQWLTRLISFFGSDNINESQLGDGTLEDAASLLAVCAGTAASGAFTRTFEFPLNAMRGSDNASSSHDPSEKVAVTLRDAPLESFDSASVGAQTWGGSCVLAEMIAESPPDFGIFPRGETISTETPTGHDPFRALELGAGTGLASLILAKVMERTRVFPLPRMQDSRHDCHADVVVATDFHPSVMANLKFNYEANFPEELQSYIRKETVPSAVTPHVFVLPLDWAIIHDYQSETINLLETHSENTCSIPPPLAHEFDLIIGADIVYEHLHARWIRSCVELFLRKPARFTQTDPFSSSPSFISPSAEPLFHLIIPLRKTHAIESRSVEDVFSEHTAVTLLRQKNENGIVGMATPELAILSKEDISCDAYSDLEETEEVVYRYYRIGWV